MKIKVIADCWYGNAYHNEGDIIDYKEKVLPSWGKAIKSIKNEGVEENNSVSEGNIKNENEGVEEQQPLIVDDKTEEELIEELERLKTIGIDNGIMVDIPEDVSVSEKIQTIKKVLIESGITF